MATQPLRLTVGRPKLGPIGTIADTIKSVVRRRRLLLYLTIADVRNDGGNSLLGNLWLIIDPAIQLAIYYFLVGMVLNRPQPDFPLFLFSAILPWRWLTMAVSGATSSVRVKDKVMRQISFPHIILPLASLSASSVSFLFGLLPLFSLYLAYPDRLTVWALAFPIVAAVQILWMIPLAITFSALNVFLRDIGNFVNHGLRIAFYVSPALFSYDRILQILEPHPPARLLLDLNPMAWILTAYRNLFYEGRPADWGALLVVALASIPFTLMSIYFFRRVAPSFPKVL
jgi:lipopolysaccharide transport system permease protein/teichoic acid transport system permease protein